MRATTTIAATVAVWALAACARSGGNGADSAQRAVASGETTAVPSPPPPESIAARQPPQAGGAPPPSSKTSRPERSPPPAPGPPPSQSDTARGIAAVVGSVPITEVVLRPPGGQQITVTGPLAREIGVASGADVWVRGRRVDARTIEVASYAVRSVDGVTAITGMLEADGERLVLVTDDGRRHSIARPPAPLRQHVGARVWISGDLGTTITAYGVLRPRR